MTSKVCSLVVNVIRLWFLIIVPIFQGDVTTCGIEMKFKKISVRYSANELVCGKIDSPKGNLRKEAVLALG